MTATNPTLERRIYIQEKAIELLRRQLAKSQAETERWKAIAIGQPIRAIQGNAA